jgi:Tht1-like nuclear fusion protein
MTWLRSIFVSSLLYIASAYSHVSFAESTNTTEVQREPHLEVSLTNGQIYQPEVYSEAISILTKMETKSSCHRLATFTLTESCQTLEQSTSSELELSEVQSEYAIRLAMCEITATKKTVSSHCTDFLPGTCSTRVFSGFIPQHKKMQKTVNGRICYPEVTKEQVQQCLKDLSNTAQWWTSYSNNLQNVHVICHTSRNAIERGRFNLGANQLISLFGPFGC